MNTKETLIPQVETTEQEKEKTDTQVIDEMSHVSGIETEGIEGEETRTSVRLEESVIYLMTGEEVVEVAGIAVKAFRTQTEVNEGARVRRRRRKSLHRT